MADVVESQAPDKLVYEPGNPLADASGYVKMPNVDVVGEMVNSMSASRSYQANVEVLNTVKSMMLKTLTRPVKETRMSIAVNVNDPTNTGVNSTSSATGSSSLTGSNASDLQSSFLTLLVAQLKNQDPTNPMQNNELTTQLAQISTVSGIEKLNTTLGSVSGQIDNSQSLQAANLIGHGVMIPGTTILAGTSTTDGTSTTTTTPFGVELQQPADKVTATIKDASGNVVRTIEIGELKAGVHTFTWDGSLTDGTKAPNGSYQVAISASNGTTQLVAQPLQFALVQGVIKGSDGNKLDLGTSGTTTLDEVRQII